LGVLLALRNFTAEREHGKSEADEHAARMFLRDLGRKPYQKKAAV